MIIDSPIISGSLLLTGSFNLIGNTAQTGSLNISGSVNTIGTITATTLVVQTITSSISSITGSTKFGELSTNTHQFTGSVNITGSMQFSNSSTITTNAGTGFLAMYANGGGLYFGGAASTNHMMISSSGNVGIGTTSPSDFIDAGLGLAIISTSGRTGLSIGSTQGTANEVLGRLSFTNTNSTNIGSKRLAYISGIRGTSDNSAYLEFGTADNALGTQRMVISQGGNVGVGTSNPQYQMTVLNTVNVGMQSYTIDNNGSRGGLRLYSNNSTGSPFIKIGAAYSSISGAAHWWRNWVSSPNSNALIWETGEGSVLDGSNNEPSSWSEKLRIDGNGLITAPYMTGKSFAMTSGGGTGTAITDTGIYVGSGDWGGFGRSTAYLVTFSANPNNGGSGEYSASHVGYINVYTGWSGSNVTTYIGYTQLAVGNNIGALTLSPTFWNGSTESGAVTRGSITGYQIRIKISGYNSSYTGANQALYIQKVLSNG
jgi:hypothetical protein